MTQEHKSLIKSMLSWLSEEEQKELQKDLREHHSTKQPREWGRFTKKEPLEIKEEITEPKESIFSWVWQFMKYAFSLAVIISLSMWGWFMFREVKSTQADNIVLQERPKEYLWNMQQELIEEAYKHWFKVEIKLIPLDPNLNNNVWSN